MSVLDHQINPDSNAATRRAERAADVRDSILEWLKHSIPSVEWEATDIDESLCCRVNGVWMYCGLDETEALLCFAGALDELSAAMKRIVRDLK